MKAALIQSFEGIEKIEIGEVPIPYPEANEVQIQVKYAGINPVDWKITEGMLKTRMDYEFPVILGWDAAGVITQVGEEVKRLKEGDSVFAYCRKEIIHDGSFAEYLCLDGQNVILKPETLSFAQACCIPLSALTAWQSLFDTAHLKTKERVLIHAGAGGVGGFAIQLAKTIGAHVITTTSQKNFDYVQQFGADEVIDYTQNHFVDWMQQHYQNGVDVVFDTVGGDTLKMSYQTVKKGGRLVTIAGIIDHALANEQQIEAEFVFVRPDGKELQKIAELFNATRLHPPTIQEIPFEDVELALRKSREGHTQGKLVLKIS
ncbi:MAG: NADP-dependent oxidoreductase [Chlamydiales bacterium]